MQNKPTSQTNQPNKKNKQPTQKTYQSTSKPVLATTLSGIDKVCRGSIIPKMGLRALEAMPKAHIRVYCKNYFTIEDRIS